MGSYHIEEIDFKDLPSFINDTRVGRSFYPGCRYGYFHKWSKQDGYRYVYQYSTVNYWKLGSRVFKRFRKYLKVTRGATMEQFLDEHKVYMRAFKLEKL